MSTTDRIDQEERFAEWLATLVPKDQGVRRGEPSARNRAILAGLRRGFGRDATEDFEPYRHLGNWLAGRSEREADRYVLVAALFAWHQGSWEGARGSDRWTTNLGASCRRLADALRQKGGSAESVERRFVGLLNSHVDDLPQHLRQMVGLLKSWEVPIDWVQLLRDVRGWDRPDRLVQRAWARSFWSAAVTGESETGSSAGAGADSSGETEKREE